MCMKSEVIYQNSKKEVMHGIFDKLDSDVDDKISINYIDTTALPERLLQILTPIFIELEQH